MIPTHAHTDLCLQNVGHRALIIISPSFLFIKKNKSCSGEKLLKIIDSGEATLILDFYLPRLVSKVFLVSKVKDFEELLLTRADWTGF